MSTIADLLRHRLGDAARVAAPDELSGDWQTRLQATLAAGEPLPAAVFPTTLEHLAAAIATAHQERWSVLVCGGGSKLSWGKPARGLQLLVSTQELTEPCERAVGDLTATAAAGMKLADLQAQLRPSGQFLPLDPAYPEAATLGGIVATADAGSWRQRYGGPRDLLLGLSFVRADGAIAKAGGRVVKNVAGYDLMKLLTGSYGSLGAIAQLTFRTYPLPEASATVLAAGELAAIARARTTLLQSVLTPTAVDLLSAELTAALGSPGQPSLLVRFQSIPASVREQVQRWTQGAESLGLSVQTWAEREEEDLWRQLNRWVRGTDNAAIACKVGLLPNQTPALLEALARLPQQPSHGQFHASSGVGYLCLPAETPAAAIADLRRLCEAHQGYLTLLEAPLALKQQLDPWGYSGNAIAAMQAIKQQFDPAHRLSPGRFLVEA